MIRLLVIGRYVVTALLMQLGWTLGWPWLYTVAWAALGFIVYSVVTLVLFPDEDDIPWR